MKKNNLSETYWSKRYADQNTGWDIGHISTPLKTYVDQLADKSMRILVPGSGNGYEVEYLWNKGFKSVFAADIARAPLNHLKSRLKNFPEEQLLHGDFFKLSGQFDLIIEQTFFCALDPILRPSYVQQMCKLLKPGGKLAGLFFNFPLTESGPPFGGSLLEYKALFEHHFELKVLEPSINSINERAGNELFFIFEKKH